MKYFDSYNNPIATLDDWEQQIFKATKKEKHWKVGRSAHSIADYMMNKNGEQTIKEIVAELLSEDVILERATPELEIRFDKYGHGREHDLGIFGRTVKSDKSIFIGVESKVDESFNETILDSYLKAKSKTLSGISTNSDTRIEELLGKHYSEVTPEHFNLRYQLLYSTVGTLNAEIENKPTDIAILFIIVFKTNLYDEVLGLENYKDYARFVKSLNGQKIKNSFNIDIRELIIDGRTLYSIYMNIDGE